MKIHHSYCDDSYAFRLGLF